MSTSKPFAGLVRVLLCALVLALATTLSAQVNVYSDPAETILVSTHTTIQAAIDAATTMDGYVVRVDAGTYDEVVTVDKPLSLLGPNATISAVTGTRVAEARLLQRININGTTTQDVTISGFEFFEVPAPSTWTIYIQGNSDNFTFENNRFIDCEKDAIRSGISSNTANVTVSGNLIQGITAPLASGILMGGINGTSVISDNKIDLAVLGVPTGYAGIQTPSATGLTISGNEISNTTNQGLQLAGVCGDVVIENNTISNTNTSNGADKGAIRLYGTDFTGPITITGNVLTSSFNGIAVKNGEDITGQDIVIDNNDLSGNSNASIYNGASDGALNTTCNWHGSDDPVTITAGITGDVTFEPFLTTGGNSIGSGPGFSPTGDCIGCAGGGLVTNTTSGETFCSIQAAIDDDDTVDGHTIIVAAGMYPEIITVNKDLIIQGPNTGIAGNGVRVAEAIIQDGKVNILGANTVVFDGFHILHISNSTSVSLGGGATATIQNCLIERNALVAVPGGPASARGIEISNGAGVKNINHNLFTGDITGGVFSGTLSWNTGIFMNGPSSVIAIEDNIFENCRTALNIDDMGVGITVSGNTLGDCGSLISFGGTVPTTGSFTLGANDYTPSGGTFINLSNVDPSFRLDITAGSVDGTVFTAIPLADLFLVETTMFHRGRSGRNGLVYYVANNQYVSASVNSNIQTAIDYAAVNDVINIQDGSYNQRLAISQPLTLDGQSKAGTVLNGMGLSGTGSGITVANNVTDVTIQDLTVQNYAGSGANTSAGIYAPANNNNLTVSNVAIQDNVNAAGFYANGPVDNVSITNSMVANHGPGARGIVIWNGMKTNITVTGNMVTNNNCCGIELQDGAASAVDISNNTIDIGSGDNAIGLTGLDESVGANTVNSNIITGGGRYGIEVKNPAGGVTVDGNNVSLTTQNTNFKDRGGIVVMRRGVLSPPNIVNADVPNGVTVTNNTVSGYVQSNAGSNSEGFGIVVEGTNHIVTGNTVQNCDVGIIQQQNPSNYPGDANDADVSDQFFGRGNSPITCGNTISGNTFSGNGVDERNIGAGSGVITNTNTGESFCSIQNAIDNATANDVLEVTAGTYDENVVVDKSLIINGPNANIACGSRVAEAIVSPTSGVPFTVTADDVTINGFEITAPTSTYGVNFGNTSNVSITFNNIHDIGTSVTNANVHAILYTVANGASTSGASITDNCFDDISSPALSGWSASAIGILQSPSTGVLNGLNIERNTINDVEVNTGNWPTGKIAYGIQINVGGGGSYLTTAGEVQNAVIRNNEISNLSGFISTGIGLEGNTKDAIVENNAVSGLFGRKDSGNRAGGAYDLSALKFENNRWVGTVTVQNNSFQVNTFTHDATPGLGYAISNYVPAGTAFTGGGGGTTGEATISCNWLGSDIFGDLADNATFTGNIFNKAGAVTNFVPYLVNDTDDDAGMIGFQPTPMSCIGGPVQVYDGNTFIAVYNEIQAAIDDVTTLSGHTVRIASGTYVENVDAVSGGKDLTFAPGASPGCVTIMGDFTLNAGDVLEIEIEGTTACTEHDQFIVTGTVTLGGATITTPLGMYLAQAGDEIVVIDGSSAIGGTFAEGNFVTDGVNTYYINYAAGVDGFDVVLTKCCDGLLDLGIFNYAAASPVGNKLQVFVRPNMDVVNGAYSAGVFTIRTLTSNAVTFTNLGATPYSYTQVNQLVDGSYTYYFFNYEAVPPMVNWTAGDEILLLELSYDCIGDAIIELTNDAFTMANNGDYYQELGAAEAQGIFYQPTAVSPTAVSITADNNGTLCATADIELSSMTSDGTAPYTYAWSGPDSYTSTLENPAPFAATLASAGTYTVTVTDANGCTATATTEVIVLDNAGCVENVTLTTFYPTITQAIDATETLDGHIIRVPAANWPENVVVTKALTINGANAGLSCDDAGRGAESIVLGTTVVTIASNGVTIDGFTIEGITGIASAGFTDVSLVNNKINAKEFGINTSLVATSAANGYTIQDNCIVFSDQVFDAAAFATSPTLSPTQVAGAWYTDRYAPAGFASEVLGGNSRLKHSINAADCQSCRPGGFNTSFYNTQGRKYDISGTTAMSIELYIPADWATTGRRMAGFWGTAVDAGNTITAFPIIEFNSEDGNPRFRGWNGSGWVDLGLPTGFAYDQWHTLEIALLPSDEFMYSVGDVSAAVPANGSVTIDNVILQGHNTDTPGVTYDIYWDNFNTFCAPVANNSPTVGVSVASANGTEAVVLQDNNVDNAFYGYGMGAVNTDARTTVRGGEFTDIMQGVSIFNTLDGANFAPSTVGVADLSMTSFSGDYPAIFGANFQSGVYVFTGGADATAVVDIAIDNVIVSNTGKISPNSSGIHFADFSTGAGNRLNAVVTDSEISNNLNRGVYVRGVNATTSVSNNEILFNGADPHGTGGNDGYGIIVNNEAAITLNNNTITNPSAQIGTDPVTAMFIGVAPAGSITAFENSINGNGNANGSLTANTYPIAQFTATCNWWTSDDIDVVDGLVDGNVLFVPYLNDGTDTDGGARGFVPTAGSCVNPSLWYVNDNDLTDDVFTLGLGDDLNQGTKRRPFRTIGKAVMTVETTTSPIPGPDDNTILVDAGSYDEQVIVPNTVGNLTLQGVGPCDAIEPALTTTLDFTGTVTGKPTLLDIAGDGTVIDGIQFNVDLTRLHSAIIATDLGLNTITVQNNCIDPYQSTPGTNLGGYGNRNAISINYGGPTNFRVASGGVDNILVDNNRVTATVNGIGLGDDAGDIGFRSAVSVDEGAGTYIRNIFQTINHDVLVRFNSNGNVVIGGSATDANTFNGGGVQYSDPNAGGGTVTISHNAFDGSVSASVLRLQNNYHDAAVTVSDNTLSNLRWGMSLENFRNVTVSENVLSPLAGFSDFRLITVNTKSISGNSASIVQNEINGIFTGNTFNSNGDDTGTAMAFYNHDSDDADLGMFTVGTVGSPNVFASGFLYAVYLGDQLGSTLAATGAFPEYALGGLSDTEMACWDRDIDVQNNSFDIGSGAQFPPTMNNAERLALEDILYHLPDNACLGELIYFDPVLVDAKVFLQGPYDSVSGLMNDNLRAGGLVPLTEPFSSINGAHPGSFVEVNNFVTETITAPVLAVTGNDAIVDWVWLELRDMADLNTVVASRSALVQRDGDIVDLDGMSGVEFPDTYVGEYYLLVRHRNHLGAMTASPVDFTSFMPIDFTVAAEPTFGATPTSARRLVQTGIYGLWAGNTLPYPAAGFQVKYNGGSNDRLPILNAVGDMTPLNIVLNTYQLEDVNMDGRVKYNGSSNDRVIILQNVGPATPLNIITQEPNN